MSTGISFGVNHALAVQRWSKELARVAPKESFFHNSGFVGGEYNNVIRIKEDLGKDAGYKVTYGLRDNLIGTTKSGDAVLEGSEYDLSFNAGSMQINQERIAEKSGGKASEMRVPYDTRAEMRDALGTYWGEHFDEIFLTKLSGSIGVNTWNTIDSTTVGFDGNPLSAPSANRILYAGGAANAAAVLGTGQAFTLDDLDRLIKLAKRQSATSVRRKLQPVKIKGKDYYVMLIDLLVDEQLRQTTGNRYYDLEKAKITGGAKDSPLMENASFVYRDVIVYVHEEMVRFSNYGGGAVKAVRNLFMGASAGYMALGPGESGSKEGFFWKERLIDFENKLAVASGKIWGFDKCKFTTAVGGGTYEDFGVIACDSYVPGF